MCEIPRHQVIATMMNFLEGVPSIKKDFEDTLENINSVANFVKTECMEGKSIPLGYVPMVKEGESLSAKQAGCLFPNYLKYCKKRQLRAVSRDNFSNAVLDVAREMGWNVEKKRWSSGIHFTGIELSPKIFTAEYLAGPGNE